jgi:DNA polymerase-3 subunit delta'
MIDNLQTILFQKYQDKFLASLYIANYNSRSIDPDLWVNDFLTQFTQIEDHPDILKIHKTDKEPQYKVDSPQIRDFLKFINYRPLQLEKKFIFIFDAHDISTILSNKLLKIFEELGANFCLFLMVPDNAYMLPTVLSRAIKLKIPNKKELKVQDLDFSEVRTPQDLLALLKENGNNAQDEKKFIEQTIEHFLTQSKDSPEYFNNLEELLKILADNETFSNFNNSKLSRMARFFP